TPRRSPPRYDPPTRPPRLWQRARPHRAAVAGCLRWLAPAHRLTRAGQWPARGSVLEVDELLDPGAHGVIEGGDGETFQVVLLVLIGRSADSPLEVGDALRRTGLALVEVPASGLA